MSARLTAVAVATAALALFGIAGCSGEVDGGGDRAGLVQESQTSAPDEAAESAAAATAQEAEQAADEAERVAAEQAAAAKAEAERVAKEAADKLAAEQAAAAAAAVAAAAAAAEAAADAAAEQPADPPATEVYYENCTAVRDAGAAPIRAGDPGYDSHLDRDGDGIGCEN